MISLLFKEAFTMYYILTHAIYFNKPSENVVKEILQNIRTWCSMRLMDQRLLRCPFPSKVLVNS